jgi:hypothetical protein
MHSPLVLLEPYCSGELDIHLIAPLIQPTRHDLQVGVLFRYGY